MLVTVLVGILLLPLAKAVLLRGDMKQAKAIIADNVFLIITTLPFN